MGQMNKTLSPSHPSNKLRNRTIFRPFDSTEPSSPADTVSTPERSLSPSLVKKSTTKNQTESLRPGDLSILTDQSYSPPAVRKPSGNQTAPPKTPNLTPSPVQKTSAKKQPQKKYDDRFSNTEAGVLVQLWKDDYDNLKSVDSRDAWVELQRAYTEQTNTERPVAKLKQKMTNMQKAYNTAKDKNNETGESLHTCLYYDVIDSVLGVRELQTTPHLRDVGLPQSVSKKVSKAASTSTISRPPSSTPANHSSLESPVTETPAADETTASSTGSSPTPGRVDVTSDAYLKSLQDTAAKRKADASARPRGKENKKKGKQADRYEELLTNMQAASEAAAKASDEKYYTFMEKVMTDQAARADAREAREQKFMLDALALLKGDK